MPPRDRPPPRALASSRQALERFTPPRDPRAEPVTVPPRPAPRPEVSLTPIGVKEVSLTAFALELEHHDEAIEDLDARVSALEAKRESLVTISDYPRVAKQHADTTAMEAIVKRRETLRGFWRAVAQALLIAALLGLFGLAWSWWTGPKPLNPPVKDPDEERRR